MMYKTLQRKLKIEQHECHKNRGDLECFGSVSNSYSTSATRSAEFRSNETLC